MYQYLGECINALAQQQAQDAASTFNWVQTLVTVVLTVIGSLVIAHTTLYLQDKRAKKRLLKALLAEVGHNMTVAKGQAKEIKQLQGIFAPAGLKQLHTASYLAVKERGILADVSDDIREQIFRVYDTIYGIHSGRFDFSGSTPDGTALAQAMKDKPIAGLLGQLTDLESKLATSLKEKAKSKDVKKMAQSKDGNQDRRFTEGIVAMTVGLTSVIVGGTVYGLPQWSWWIFIAFGIVAYAVGLRWYRSSR